MNTNFITLEYDTLKTQILPYCKTYLGKNLVKELLPSFKQATVEKQLQETKEAQSLKIQIKTPPISEIADISISLKHLKSQLPIAASSLLELAHILKIARELKQYFYDDEILDNASFPLLEDYFSSLYTNINIENKIFSSIIDAQTIADDASTHLKSIRKNKKKLENTIKETLNHLIHSSFSKFIREPIITVRNERYVIPIKEEYRSSVKGFIHDISSSGSTVFIEPMRIFELNNELNNLKLEENQEIEKILQELSTLLFPFIEDLTHNSDIIGKLDFIFAKVDYADTINGVFPHLTTEKCLSFKNARHPLINPEQVVPVDISIGETYTSLIITGPNTGGKTVTLKTTGLLCLMAYSGLFIPVEEESKLCVFDQVFADIGDEQSIQESLSTFSSHMYNIVSIIEKATNNSLILLDELGSGTDPLEGAALAISILEHFHQKGCLTFATTHYPEIKHYALVTDGFENASSAFDLENLKPTYRLLIGVPGRSNAFAISQKLGISSSILERATHFMKQEDISIEDLLKNIHDDKLKIEEEKEEIEKNLHQVTDLRKSLEKKTTNLQDKESQLHEKAKKEIQDMLLSSKEKVNAMIKEINAISSDFEIFDTISLEELSDTELAHLVRAHFGNELSTYEKRKRVNDIRKELNHSISSVSLEVASKDSPSEEVSFTKKDLQVGMQVFVKNITSAVTIDSLSGKADDAMGRIGNIKMAIKISDIYKIMPITNFPTTSSSKNNATFFNNASSNNRKKSSLKSANIAMELNIIGLNVEEALPIVDKYLDDCYLARLSSVRIVHGKGTGKLRDGVHQFLKKDKRVKSYRMGTFGEGEMGVTVVEFS